MSRRPFTLIELVIAIGVFSMVAVALFVFSSNVADSWSRLSVERNRFSELMELDRAVESIFPNVVPFLWRDPAEETIVERPFIVATDTVLRVAYLHRLNDADEGAIRFVELKVEDNELTATYTDRPFLDWDMAPPDRIRTSVLATGVESVTFQYADHINDVAMEWNERLFWQLEWETEESERTDVPLAIQMTVQWQDGRTESWLRRTMGVSYRERFGTWSLPQDNGI